jgi:CheY-like chemotaxis protein
MKKLNEILLIDDSKGSNILNKRLIKEMDITDKITTVLNGSAAINYLISLDKEGNLPKPEIIFLDINMPVMDGYQFLEKYSEVIQTEKANQLIIMLSSSEDEVDLKRSQNYPMVRGYQSKPLTKEKVKTTIKMILK